MNIKNIFKELTKVKIMIHSTKRFYAMIFAICCMSNIMQSNDTRDEQGRTEIMNYLIEQEKEITSKWSELYRLFDKYFIRNKETNILEKRIWATDEDVVQYRKFEDEFDWLIEETIENIKSMILHGANLQARDMHGKTVRDYCNTKRIDYVLREFNAPMTLGEYYFGAGVLGIGMIYVTAFTAAVCYRICFPLPY